MLLQHNNRPYWLPCIHDIFDRIHILLPYTSRILRHSDILLPHTKQLIHVIPTLNQQELQFIIDNINELNPYYSQINDNIDSIKPYLPLIMPYKIEIMRNMKYIAPYLNQLAPFMPEISARLPALIELKHIDSTENPSNNCRSPVRLDKNNHVIYKHTMFDRLCLHLDVIHPYIPQLLTQFDNLLPHYDAILDYAPYLLPHCQSIMASIDITAPRLHRIEKYFDILSTYATFIFDTQTQMIWRDKARIDVLIDCMDEWIDYLPIIVDNKSCILPLLYPLALHYKQIHHWLPKSTTWNTTNEQPPQSRSPALYPLKTTPISPLKSQSVSRLAAIKRLSGSHHSLASLNTDSNHQTIENTTTTLLYMIAPYSDVLAAHMNELIPHLNILLPDIYNLLPLIDVFVTKIDSIIPLLNKSITTPDELHQQLLLIRALPGYAKISSYLNHSPASIKKLGQSIFTSSHSSHNDINELDNKLNDQEFQKRSSSYTSNILNGAMNVGRSIGSIKSYLRTPTGSRQPSPTRNDPTKDNCFVVTRNLDNTEQSIKSINLDLQLAATETDDTSETSIDHCYVNDPASSFNSPYITSRRSSIGSAESNNSDIIPIRPQ